MSVCVYVCVCVSVCVSVYACLPASDDSEEWMHAADGVIELLTVLRQHGDLIAEFFLLCLQVYQGFYYEISTLICTCVQCVGYF